MPVFDLYSKRHKAGATPDVYDYDNLPNKLRAQYAFV
jgi:hypothetical protein